MTVTFPGPATTAVLEATTRDQKLTRALRSEIRRVFATGLVTKSDLAKVYGVSAATVNQIVSGAWSHGERFRVRRADGTVEWYYRPQTAGPVYGVSA